MPSLYFFYFSKKNHSFYKSESISPKKGRLPVFSLDKRPVFYSFPFRFCYSSCKRASSSGSNSQFFRFWLIRMAQKLGPHIVQYFPLKWFPAL